MTDIQRYKETYKDTKKDTGDISQIYIRILLEKAIQKNGSLIPSRNEEKTNVIKWKVVWKNQVMLKGVTAVENCTG